MVGISVLIAIAVFAVIELNAYARGGDVPPDQLMLGAPLPELYSTLGSGGTVVLWAFDADGCMSCGAPSQQIRTLLRARLPNVRIVMSPVDLQPNLLASFLRRERLEGEVIPLTKDDYSTMFGSTPLPGVLVYENGLLGAAWLGSGDASGLPGQEDTITLADKVQVPP